MTARNWIRTTLDLPSGSVTTPATLRAGLRAGTATVVPILFAYALGQPLLVWTALGGWLSTFADGGGAYRTRARTMGAFAIAGALSVGVGALAARMPWAAVLLVLAWAVGGAMLRLFGDAATSVGSLLAVTFVASLGAPSDMHGASLRAALFVAGCVWAMMLSLLVWPLRPWQPARDAVGACYVSLAEYARGIGAALRASPGVSSPWHALALREHAKIRLAIETARMTLGETRRMRVGSSRRGEDLVVLLENAELLFETLVAGAEAVEAATRALPNDSAVPSALYDALDAIAVALDAVGTRVSSTPRWRETSPPAPSTADDRVLALWAVVDALDAGRAAPALQAATIVEHAATLADTSTEAVGSLVLGRAPPSAPATRFTGSFFAQPASPGIWAVLVANLSTDSLVLRHAARAGIVAALATWAGAALQLPHATWVTMTALIILQPYAGATRQRGAERVIWTVLGGIVAAVLAALLHDRFVIAAIMFPLAVASIAVRASHYGLYTFFLTPVFVLLAEPASGDWRMAGVRALDTLLGGALALAANRVLWPSWEHRRLPGELAQMLEAIRAYFRGVEWRALGAAASTPSTLGAARRRVGLAGNNVDASIQRVVAEPHGPLGDVESLMTMLTFCRRIAGVLTVLAVGAAPGGATERATLARAIDATLADLAVAVRAERAPGALPDVVARHANTRGDAVVRSARTTGEHPAAALGVERVARQVAVLHAAATRAFALRS